MASLGELTVQIGANSREFDAQMASVRTSLSATAEKMRGLAKTAAGIGIAATAAGAAIAVHITRQSLEAAKNIQVLADAANMSVQQFQNQAFAVNTVGVNMDQYSAILTDVQDRIGEYLQTGGGPLIDFFQKLAPTVGVTAREFANLRPDQALSKFVGVMEKAGLNTKEMVFHMGALSSQSSRLLPLLLNDSAGLRKVTDRAKELGVALSPQQLMDMAEAQVAVNQSMFVMESALRKVVAGIAPFIEAFADSVAETSSGFGDLSASAMEAFKGITTGIGFVLDTFRGLHVALSTIQTAFNVLGSGVASILATIVQGWALMIAGIAKKIGDLIRIANNLPFVEISTKGIDNFTKSMEDVADGAKEMRKNLAGFAVDSARKLQELAMQPMPSKVIDEWVAGVEKKLHDVRNEAAATQNGLGRMGKSANAVGLNLLEAQQAQGGGQQQPGGDALDAKEAQAQRSAEIEQERIARERALHLQEVQTKLDTLKQSFATEQQLEMQKFTSRMAILAESNKLGLVTQQKFNSLKEKEEKRHSERMQEIAQSMQSGMSSSYESFIRSMTGMDKMGMGARVQTVSKGLAQMTAGTARHNETMFKLNKALAVSNAVMDTYAGAQKAVATLGPIAGPAMAAVIIATGMARVSAIASRQFNTGGGGGAAGGGAAPSAMNTPAPAVTDTGQRGQAITLNIHGSDRAMFTRQQVRDLIEQINEAAADGTQVLVA